MKWSSIRAILRQEWYVTKASWEMIFDIFVFSLANIVLFGYIATYLAAGSSDRALVESLLITVIFWEIIRINQYSISVSSMWNVWSHNLCNMFIAPLRTTEYLLAHIMSATLKSIFVLVCSFLLATQVFHVDILSLGLLPIVLTYLNMAVFATAIGLVLIGLVFQFGTKIQAFTWGTIFMIQPLCAVFFPVSVLPGFLQLLAQLFPVTYFFEWLRALHQGMAYSNGRIALATAYNLLWLIAACWLFSRQLVSAKRSGQFVRNDL